MAKRTEESVRQREAYEYWKALGLSRSYRLVGAKYDVSAVTICKWAKRWDWRQRLELEAVVPVAHPELIKPDYSISTKNDLLPVINAAIEQIVQKKDGVPILQVPIRNVSDFERMVKLHLLLSGEATDIHAIKIETVQVIIGHIVQVVERYIDDPNDLSAIAQELRDSTLATEAKQGGKGRSNLETKDQEV